MFQSLHDGVNSKRERLIIFFRVLSGETNLFRNSNVSSCDSVRNKTELLRLARVPKCETI